MSRGQVSWAQLEISNALTHGTDSGTGADSGVRVTASGSSKSGSDSGVGADSSSLLVGPGITLKAGSDFGFGVAKYAAAGLTFLFYEAEETALLETTEAAKAGSDSGVGTDSSEVLLQDRTIAKSDTGVGVDSSSRVVTVNDLSASDSGTGTDAGAAFPSASESLPEAVLEVAFGSNPTDETPVFTVVSSDSSGRQIEFTVKRGRQDELKEPETGTLITTLFNQARAFDPAYTLSPYYPNVLPVKQVRLSAVRGSATYPLYVGDVEQWPQQQEGRLNKATIQANDAFDALNQVQLEITRPEELTGARINAILDAAMWPASARNIDTGQTLLHANAYTGSALELLRNVVADEDGYFFISGGGKTRFIERHSRFKPPYTTPRVTLSTRPTGSKLPLSAADYQVDKDFIKNQIILTVEAILDSEGTTIQEEQKFTVADVTSQDSFRPRALTLSNSALADLNEAQTKVEYLLDRLKDPLVRVRSVTIEPQQDTRLWQHALGREIGDRVAIEIYPVQTGTEEVVYFEGIIEYIEHRYVVRRWQTTWYLSPADLNDYWILEDSSVGVLGTTTRLGY